MFYSYDLLSFFVSCICIPGVNAGEWGGLRAEWPRVDRTRRAGAPLIVADNAAVRMEERWNYRAGGDLRRNWGLNSSKGGKLERTTGSDIAALRMRSSTEIAATNDKRGLGFDSPFLSSSPTR